MFTEILETIVGLVEVAGAALLTWLLKKLNDKKKGA